MASSYVELQRFQNHASHYKPHVLDHQSAMDHLRSMAALRYDAAPGIFGEANNLTWGAQRQRT